jgi:hypothetical protein
MKHSSKLTPKPFSREEINELLRSRANLKHLIYSMEHDPSLHAQQTKILVLRDLLNGIEQQIGARN